MGAETTCLKQSRFDPFMGPKTKQVWSFGHILRGAQVIDAKPAHE